MKNTRTLRTAALGLGVAAVAATALASPALASAPAHATDPSSRPTIVLEHGAWADSSSWDLVRQQLQHDGYAVLVPPNPLRGLSSDAGYLSTYLAQRTTGPVVLVGHSYGGAVITNAALSDPHVTALVYVDAFMPDSGESVGSIVGSSTSALNVADPSSVYDVVGLSDGSAEAYLKPTVMQEDVAADLSPLQQQTVIADQLPIALGAVSEASGIPAWKSIKTYSVIGTHDLVLPEATQLQEARRAHSEITLVGGSHLSLISKWRQVAAVIETAAR
ncbi:alpha/beta fold hydrolase [Lysinimonas soli]|uniref:Alpha/beta fold hydrolase n=1 Tax=Lysinimonas soli TaxID=1074233 RepID=A0ABW0NJZ2_9MICO